MREIKKKKYYRIVFSITSPLTIGSGENDVTDKDIIKDSEGIPYIPASSIAGVICQKLAAQDEKEAKKYMGYVKPEKVRDREESISEGVVVLYDATKCADSSFTISVRDSVSLDEYKTAKKGAKFDMEILEPGVKFETFIEQSFDDTYDKDYGAKIVDAFLKDNLSFGGKTTRGYGDISVDNVDEKEFDFENPDNIDKWLEFDLYTFNDWTPCKVEAKKGEGKTLTLELKQKGAISIRRYTTKVSKDDETQPDMEQLTLHDGEIPVIPGTSWAGAFRHRMKEFGIDTDGMDSIFGYVAGDGKNEKVRSKLYFGESQLKNGKFQKLSRNSIDRFFGGTVNGALFTERVYYDGTTELKIGWNSNEAIPEEESKALTAALTDLHFGFLAVGGETSIGRGLFTIVKINGETIKTTSSDKQKEAEEIYSYILKKIREAFDE